MLRTKLSLCALAFSGALIEFRIQKSEHGRCADGPTSPEMLTRKRHVKRKWNESRSLCFARFVYVFVRHASKRAHALAVYRVTLRTNLYDHGFILASLSLRMFTLRLSFHTHASPFWVELFMSGCTCMYAVSCRRDRWTCSARAFWLARALVHNIYAGAHDGWLLSVLYERRGRLSTWKLKWDWI